jgi:hypothetical protein
MGGCWLPKVFLLQQERGEECSFVIFLMENAWSARQPNLFQIKATADVIT